MEFTAATSLHASLLGCFACPLPCAQLPAARLGQALLLTCPASGARAVAHLRAAASASAASLGLDLALTLWGDAAAGGGAVLVRALAPEELPPLPQPPPPPAAGAEAPPPLQLRAHPLGLVPSSARPLCSGSDAVDADALDDGALAWDGWRCSAAPAVLAPVPWGSERLAPAQCALLAALLHNRLLAPAQCVLAPLLGAEHPAAEGSLAGWCALRVLPACSSGGGASSASSGGALLRVHAAGSVIHSMARPPPAAPARPPLPLPAAWLQAASALAPGQGSALARLLSAAAAAAAASACLGVLLTGPPGAGKSQCAGAAAAASGCPVLRLGSPSLFAGELGGSEARVLRVGAAARAGARAAGQAWVLVEDGEALLPGAPGSALAARCRDLLLAQMDECAAAAAAAGAGGGGGGGGSVVWCVMTNHPGALAPGALGPSRLHLLLQLGLPGAQARAQQLAACLRSGSGVGGAAARAAALQGSLQAAAEATHGFSCADLARLAGVALSEDGQEGSVSGSASASASATRRLPPPDTPWAPALRAVRPSLLAHATGAPPRAIPLATLFPSPALRAGVSAVLLPLLHAARYASLGAPPPAGLLITGPPGSGKTTLAHALAHAVRCRGAGQALVLTGPDLVSPQLGASEAALARAFAAARALAPCVLVIDHFEALAPARARGGGGGGGGGSDGSDGSHGAARHPAPAPAPRHHDRLLSVLLTELDGIGSGGRGGGGGGGGGGGVCLVAVAGSADALDGAVLRPGRLDCRAECALPGGEERAWLLRGALQGGEGLSEGLCAAAVRATAGCSQAQVVHVARAAAWSALRRGVAALQGGEGEGEGGGAAVAVGAEDIEAALRELPGGGAGDAASAWAGAFQ